MRPQAFGVIDNSFGVINKVSRNTIYSGVFYLFLFVQVTEGIKHDAERDFRVFTYLI